MEVGGCGEVGMRWKEDSARLRTSKHDNHAAVIEEQVVVQRYGGKALCA